jgi:hypothetical protein
MALSLLHNPVDYSSAHGQLIFTLLEDTKPFNSSLYPDYKYVCDIYIDGTQVARLKAFPRPGDKIGFFDIGNVIRNYLTSNFSPFPNDLRAEQIGENHFYVNVICRFGEEYGGVTYTNIIVDTQRTYFNHYNKRLPGQNTILTNYLDKVMSTRPYATPVYRDAKFCLIPFLPTDDTTINLIIKSYNSGGLVATTTQPYTPFPGSSNVMQLYNIAPPAINASAPGFINDFISYYTVEFNTTNITEDSIYRFDLVCEPKFEVYTIHFMNQFGGYESKDFTKVSRRRVEVEKSDHGSASYTISAEGIPQYYDINNVYKETRRVYAGAWKEKMTLNSDLLTDAEYDWLEDLILSPLIYVQIGDYHYPAVVTDSNYEPKKIINDDLTNLTINIEYGDRFNTQYR